MNRTDRFMQAYYSIIGNPRTKQGKSKKFQSPLQYAQASGEDFERLRDVIGHKSEPADEMCERMAKESAMSLEWIKTGDSDSRLDAIDKRIKAIELSLT